MTQETKFEDEKEHKGISRRQFVVGAAVGVAAAAAVGSVGTYMLTPRPATGVPSSWDYTADVVIVGLGFAGQTAAITAHDAGANVIVLEKEPENLAGGNSRVDGQCCWVPGTNHDGTVDSANIPSEIQYFESFFKPTSGEDYTFPSLNDYITTQVNEAANNKTWFEGLGATMVWSAFPQPFYPQLPGAGVVSMPNGGSWSVKGTQPYGNNWYFLQQQITNRGINVMYSTPAQNLIQNPQTNEILGVVATSGSKTINVKAKKAVILAAGGYEFNPQMVKDYLALPEILSLGSPYNTGDGVLMAIGAGANLWHMDV